ncbi:hypothetical protein Q2T42_30530 [Leptolyngbya boryana CZ1]|uniref:Uncharacterized protein n=1 Tax=Leptolyngbya boryana CZ1 TaxID=3060204 RepID=A0AA96WW13_LEPBY|nr:hypothetical protein [Leptolyngbya boryana]WNZ46128.1 hypothetical protein Q2T42_30530 [Leptolyngbya boryana CZ1]
MTEQSLFPITVQPVISYPREAEVGKTYLMTIDLQVVEGSEWQFEEEEYPIYCIVESEPLFKCKAVGESAIVLHRFGGSYGAAKFLITSVKGETIGEIKLTLINTWGVPVKQISLATSNRSELANSSMSALIAKQYGSDKSKRKQLPTSENPRSSKRLFAAYLQGNAEAGIDLVLNDQKFHNEIREIARRQFSFNIDQEDAVQAAFMRLIEAIRRDRFIPDFFSWCLSDLGCKVHKEALLVNVTNIPTNLSILWELDPLQNSVYFCFRPLGDIAVSIAAPVFQLYPGHPMLNAVFSLRKEYFGGEKKFYQWSKLVARFALMDFARQTWRQSKMISVDSHRIGEDLLAPTVEVEYKMDDIIAAITLIDRQYPQKKYEMICQGLLQGKLQRTIARELGVSESEISKRKIQLRKFITSYLEVAGEDKFNEIWQHGSKPRKDKTQEQPN